MGVRGFMADQNIRLECLQVLYVFGKDRATVLAGKTFTPEIPFSTMRKERLAVGVRRWLWRVPDLATETPPRPTTLTSLILTSVFAKDFTVFNPVGNLQKLAFDLSNPFNIGMLFKHQS